MKHFGDITKINGSNVPAVDVICGGSPCQDLSIAGKRSGLDGERSGLFMDQIRIVKEMRKNGRSNDDMGFSRPRFMVWENVYGAFSSNKGEDFRVVLEEICKVADPDAVVPRLEGGRNGEPAESLWETDIRWLGEVTMHNIGECLNAEKGYVYLLTLTDTPHRDYYLKLNCGEKPMKMRETKLSEILERTPNAKYKLSEKACQGILNRAERRGKKLPEILKNALETQATLLKSGGVQSLTDSANEQAKEL